MTQTVSAAFSNETTCTDMAELSVFGSVSLFKTYLAQHPKTMPVMRRIEAKKFDVSDR